MIFQDRVDAGNKLGDELAQYANKKEVVVLGLARGGIVIAAAVANKLKVPFDVVVVRKIGAPDNEELALGAVSEEGEGVFNENLISMLGVSKEYLLKAIEKQKEIVKERKRRYLEGRSSIDCKGKTVILVDDGIATGASMKVAIESVHAQNAGKIVLAVPVAAPDSLQEMEGLVDEVVCLHKPTLFQAVGGFYKDFAQVSDEEVKDYLKKG